MLISALSILILLNLQSPAIIIVEELPVCPAAISGMTSCADGQILKYTKTSGRSGGDCRQGYCEINQSEVSAGVTSTIIAASCFKESDDVHPVDSPFRGTIRCNLDRHDTLANICVSDKCVGTYILPTVSTEANAIWDNKKVIVIEGISQTHGITVGFCKFDGTECKSIGAVNIPADKINVTRFNNMPALFIARITKADPDSIVSSLRAADAGSLWIK